MWARRRAISIFMWITLQGSKILSIKKTPKLMLRQMMMIVEAPRVITLAAAF